MATIVLAVCAVLALVAGIIGWFFRRGGDEKVLAVAVNDNTSATRELTTEFRDFKDSMVADLHSLDIRVTRLEAPRDARTPADRDAGTPG